MFLFYFRERVHVPSHSLVMLASTACRTSWSTSPSTMASASISSVWVSVSCRSSFFPWGETNHLLQCMSHPFTVNAYWFCPVTHLLNTGALMESSCRNSRFDFIHILISCADWRFAIFTKYPSKKSLKKIGEIIFKLCYGQYYILLTPSLKHNTNTPSRRNRLACAISNLSQYVVMMKMLLYNKVHVCVLVWQRGCASWIQVVFSVQSCLTLGCKIVVKFMTKMVIFSQSNNIEFWVIKSRERKSDTCLNTTRHCVMSLRCADAPFILVTGEWCHLG